MVQSNKPLVRSRREDRESGRREQGEVEDQTDIGHGEGQQEGEQDTGEENQGDHGEEKEEEEVFDETDQVRVAFWLANFCGIGKFYNYLLCPWMLSFELLLFFIKFSIDKEMLEMSLP